MRVKDYDGIPTIGVIDYPQGGIWGALLNLTQTMFSKFPIWRLQKRESMKSSSSLVNRIAIVVCAVVLTSLVSMATTLAVSKSIEGNATAINLTGALRMGAFRLLAHAAIPDDGTASEQSVHKLTSHYELSLTDNNITRAIPEASTHALAMQYRTCL